MDISVQESKMQTQAAELGTQCIPLQAEVSGVVGLRGPICLKMGGSNPDPMGVGVVDKGGTFPEFSIVCCCSKRSKIINIDIIWGSVLPTGCVRTQK